MGFYAPVWSFCLQEQSEVGWQGMWPINTSPRHFPKGTTARFPCPQFLFNISHTCETAGKDWHKTLSRFSVGSQQSSSTCSVIRWKRFFAFCFLNLKVYPTGKPWSSARGLWSERRRQHLQHRKSPASHVWQVRFQQDWVLTEGQFQGNVGSKTSKAAESRKAQKKARRAFFAGSHA